MREYRLSPADALHLAIAQKKAKTFIAADPDFSRLQANMLAGDLTVMYVPKP